MVALSWGPQSHLSELKASPVKHSLWMRTNGILDLSAVGKPAVSMTCSCLRLPSASRAVSSVSSNTWISNSPCAVGKVACVINWYDTHYSKKMTHWPKQLNQVGKPKNKSALYMKALIKISRRIASLRVLSISRKLSWHAIWGNFFVKIYQKFKALS